MVRPLALDVLMTAPRYTLLALALGAFALASAACDRVNAPSELERAIAAEQEAIAAYSAAVPRVDELQRAFVDAWKAAHELTELKAFKESLEATVLPALDRYLEAAAAMPTRSPELARIHAITLDAYRAARDVFADFAANVSEDTLDAGHARVIERLDAVKAAEATYLEQLKTHYAKNRVDLVLER